MSLIYPLDRHGTLDHRVYAWDPETSLVTEAEIEQAIEEADSGWFLIENFQRNIVSERFENMIRILATIDARTRCQLITLEILHLKRWEPWRMIDAPTEAIIELFNWRQAA